MNIKSYTKPVEKDPVTNYLRRVEDVSDQFFWGTLNKLWGKGVNTTTQRNTLIKGMILPRWGVKKISLRDFMLLRLMLSARFDTYGDVRHSAIWCVKVYPDGNFKIWSFDARMQDAMGLALDKARTKGKWFIARSNKSGFVIMAQNKHW